MADKLTFYTNPMSRGRIVFLPFVVGAAVAKMKDFFLQQSAVAATIVGHFVAEPAVVQLEHLHAVRHERQQLAHLPVIAPDHFSEAVAAQKYGGLHLLSEFQRRLQAVRAVMLCAPTEL